MPTSGIEAKHPATSSRGQECLTPPLRAWPAGPSAHLLGWLRTQSSGRDGHAGPAVPLTMGSAFPAQKPTTTFLPSTLRAGAGAPGSTSG